jgi:cytochrome b561
MRIFNSSESYGAIPQAVHWLTVILVAIAWVLGIFGDDLAKGGPRRAGLFIHVSAGLAVMALLVFRLVWNLANRPPQPESTGLGVWADRLGQTAHYLLYTLLIAVPVVGIVLQFARGDALSIFGIADISSPWVKDRAFARNVKEVHEVLAHTLIFVGGLHAAAALFHHWVLRDRTLTRMLPRAGE